MFLKRFLTVLITFTLLFCTSHSDQTFFKNLKGLEYARSSDVVRWGELFIKADNDGKITVIKAIAKTKNDTLLPFLENAFASSENYMTLKKEIVFAIGQVKASNSEKVLIDFYNKTNDYSLKKAIISAFEQCGTEVSLPLLQAALKDDSLRSAALTCSGILARKKIDVKTIKNIVSDSLWAFNSTKENAYFIYNASDTSDFKLIAAHLGHTIGLAQKYYLRALQKVIFNDDFRFNRIDSVTAQKLSADLREVLKKGTWQNQYYTLQSFHHFADSTDIIGLERLIKNSNPNVKKAAIACYAQIFKEDAAGFLLNRLKDEQDFAIKGKIIFALAGIDPQKAYRLIMQNLDKGTISFKEDLLNALALYKNPIASQALKNYLFVQEKRLVNTAFSLLDKKKMLRVNDISGLVKSGHLSTAWLALDWQNKNKKFLEDNALVEAFEMYTSADEFEIQEAIIDVLVEKKSVLNNAILTRLFNKAATPKIVKKLQKLYPGYYGTLTLNEPSQAGYLNIDSLLNASQDIFKMKIETSKGAIILELYPQVAPMTVHNFVSLAERGFYDNLIFHRVVPDFVIQGGDPAGDGWGAAGYTIPSEDYLDYKRGTVGIATAGFDTGSCQFFICQSEQPHLRANYTAFAQVIEGMEIVDKIQIDDKIISITHLN